jgi:hypothetical protein
MNHGTQNAGARACAWYAEARKLRGVEPIPTALRRLGQWAKKTDRGAGHVQAVAVWMAGCDVTDPVLASLRVDKGQEPFQDRQSQQAKYDAIIALGDD